MIRDNEVLLKDAVDDAKLEKLKRMVLHKMSSKEGDSLLISARDASNSNEE